MMRFVLIASLALALIVLFLVMNWLSKASDIRGRYSQASNHLKCDCITPRNLHNHFYTVAMANEISHTNFLKRPSGLAFYLYPGAGACEASAIPWIFYNFREGADSVHFGHLRTLRNASRHTLVIVAAPLRLRLFTQGAIHALFSDDAIHFASGPL